MTPPTANRAPLLDLPTLVYPERASLQNGQALSPRKRHLIEHSTLKGLKLCRPAFKKRCSRRLCDHCSVRFATRARGELRRYAATHPHALFIVLSVETSPSIAKAWDDLARTREKFMATGWLSANSSSWMRCTEVTHSPDSWHPHDNVLMFCAPEDHERLRREVVDRWLKSATDAGVHASAEPQHASTVRSMHKVSAYVVKGSMVPSTHPERGQSLGDILDGYVAGDADAAELWEEVESWSSSTRTRWTSKGGDLRASKPARARAVVPRTPVYTIVDLAHFKSLPFSEQMKKLGCSSRQTVYTAIKRAELELCA